VSTPVTGRKAWERGWVALVAGRWIALSVGLGLAGCASTSTVTTTTPSVTAATDLGHCLGPHQTEVPAWQLQKVDHLPVAIQQVPPLLPDNALEARIDGTVALLVLVCADGSLQDLKITRSIPMLDAAAIDAVRQWTFQPATIASEPVAAWTEARVEFRLPPRGASTEVR
jgi:TonB family protein